MAFQSRLSRGISVIVLLLVVGLGVSDAIPQTGPAPGPCRVGVQAPAFGFWTWAANSHVNVYIVTADFTAEQISYLLTALQNWNAVSELTGSDVTFEYQGGTASQLTCANCLTIMRGSVFDKSKRHATELRAYSAHGDQIITYAAIVVDPILTNPRALKDAVAHELGHNLGLLDCYTCKNKSTVMSQFKAVNTANEMGGPSGCDIAQVKAAYQELKIRVGPSPTNRGHGSEDQGEEPVDDDTPIVIRKP